MFPEKKTVHSFARDTTYSICSLSKGVPGVLQKKNDRCDSQIRFWCQCKRLLYTSRLTVFEKTVYDLEELVLLEHDILIKMTNCGIALRATLL